MNAEFFLILAAFGVVLWLTVMFTRRRTQEHDNSFVRRKEVPHVAPYTPPPPRTHVLYTPGPATTTVAFDEDNQGALVQAAITLEDAVEVLCQPTFVGVNDDQPAVQFQGFGGGDSGGGATGSWDDTPQQDDQQQQADPEPDSSSDNSDDNS